MSQDLLFSPLFFCPRKSKNMSQDVPFSRFSRFQTPDSRLQYSLIYFQYSASLIYFQLFHLFIRRSAVIIRRSTTVASVDPSLLIIPVYSPVKQAYSSHSCNLPFEYKSPTSVLTCLFLLLLERAFEASLDAR